MSRRALLAISFVLLCTGSASAQIIRPQIRSSPAAFASLGFGWLQVQGFCDKSSGDCWGFSMNVGAPQWRVSVELPLGNGSTTWGLVGTTSRYPLQYQGSGLGTNSCLNCDADANVSQVLGLLRMGGGQGFHQVIDLAAGATIFSNFRASDGTRLGTGKATSRFTGDIGYGFGYGFSNRTEIFLEQAYGLIFLPRVEGSGNTSQQATFKIGGRIGLGDRRY